MSHSDATHPAPPSFWVLFIGCIGVVYGDIGTSPLYAMRESLAVVAGDGVDPAEVLGVISLLLWALILVVTVKYICFIMQADNNGEGGTLSLMALLRNARHRYANIALGLGMVGAALFYGDAMITPAISVLSAVEGLKLVTPAFTPYVVPITIGILIGLFAVQSRGTASVASFFGPITLLWFISIALVAIPHIATYPQVLQSMWPSYALRFFVEHHELSFVVLGAVFLAVTGAEALYADMGHFGRKPIRWAWMVVVFPALAINYLGQGALILQDVSALENPFFLMCPEWALIPMVCLATAATVIASQAVITGAYSLTQQAIQLGLLPRIEIRHTSERLRGQIYIPHINGMLLVGVLVLVLMFQSSSALAAAYGIAVTGTMLMTTMLAYLVMRYVWQRPRWMALAVAGPFLVIDAVFLIANGIKVLDGGYIPLLLGGGIVLVMWTWIRGSRVLARKSIHENVPLDNMADILERSKASIVPGLAVFLTSEPEVAPTSLMHNFKHNKVLHETNVVMAIRTEARPRVSEEDRLEFQQLSPHFYRAVLHYGYMDMPNISRSLAYCRQKGLKFDIMATSFFLGRRILKPSPKSRLPRWQARLFIFLSKNATNATEFFNIPPGRVVELGSQVTV